MARPKAKIDETEVEKLAGLFCSLEEIASFFNVNISTIQRRFAHAIEAGRNKGKISLKRKQYLVAMDGNVQMLIWLGKQHLEQKDKREDTITTNQPIMMAYDPKNIRPPSE